MSSIHGCDFKKAKPKSLEYIGCHRFDQSVLNTIIVRDYGKEVFKDIFDSVLNEMTVIRQPTNIYTKSMKKCSPKQ